MSLSKIIADVVADAEAGGVVDRHAAINAAVPMVMADSELVETLIRAELSKRIKSFVCKAADAAGDETQQHSLFGLRQAHALDEADGIIKQTRSMTRLEFHGLIALRRRQMEADRAYLQVLEEAAQQTAPIWDRHPDWLWGQVEDTFAALSKVA